MQAELERLAEEQTKLLGQKLSAAIMVVDHTTGEVLAHVGSAGYLDTSRLGAIDMVDAVRSPGSTLKPFIYGLAFEAGLAHPETLIEDRPTRFGTYSPENFDDEFHGTVTIREALGQSLNVPAVKVLSAVGPGKLIGRFRRAAIEPVLPAGAEPSLAMALGGVGLTLKDLVALYSGLARGGEPVTLTWRRETKPRAGTAARNEAQRRRLLSPVAAWYVTDILKDAPPPPNTKGGRIAYKTGTSYGYRDAWAIGYDGKYTIAVWVGRPDGASTPGLMGRLAAAPILFDAFARVSERRAPLPAAPRGALKVDGANLPPPLKRFQEGPEEIAHGPLPRSARAHLVPARSRRARRRGARRGAGSAQSRRRRAAADVARRRHADHIRSRRSARSPGSRTDAASSSFPWSTPRDASIASPSACADAARSTPAKAP